jgi:hypothetical protein
MRNNGFLLFAKGLFSLLAYLTLVLGIIGGIALFDGIFCFISVIGSIIGFILYYAILALIRRVLERDVVIEALITRVNEIDSVKVGNVVVGESKIEGNETISVGSVVIDEDVEHTNNVLGIVGIIFLVFISLFLFAVLVK